jgi:hypothetical protein
MKTRTAVYLLLIASVVISAMTVIPYVWYFRSASVSSTDPGAWANFGNYVGGILGPAFSLLNLLAIIYIAIRINEIQQRDLVTKRLSIDLFTEWHAEALHQSRIVISDLIAAVQRGERQLPTLSELEQAEPGVSRHAFRLYHFFERWAVLVRECQVDEKLLQSALGGRARWYEQMFFSPIRSREYDRYICATLDLIETQVFSKLNRVAQLPADAPPGDPELAR